MDCIETVNIGSQGSNLVEHSADSADELDVSSFCDSGKDEGNAGIETVSSKSGSRSDSGKGSSVYAPPVVCEKRDAFTGRQIKCGGSKDTGFVSLNGKKQKSHGLEILQWVLKLIKLNGGWARNMGHGNKGVFFEALNSQLFAPDGLLNQ